MGRNDDKKARTKAPKDPLADGHDIEFSEELADYDDKKAQQRSQQAHQRAKKKY